DDEASNHEDASDTGAAPKQQQQVDRGIFDSGCSRHMTGNKDQLEAFKEFNGGSVTFEGSKGYITEAPSVTQPQPSSTVVPPTQPTTQPIPSEATTIPPLSQPAPPIPIAETTTASPSPSPSPTHEPIEHTFEQPLTDQQLPTP
ncbi:hypothetical protein Tco_0106493, partial [Tanacetum coccineum]